MSCTELTLLLELDLEDFVGEAVRYMISHPRRPYRQRGGTVTVAKDSADVPEPGHAVIVRGQDPQVLSEGEACGDIPDGAVVALVWEDESARQVIRAEVRNGGKDAWRWQASDGKQLWQAVFGKEAADAQGNK